MVKKIQFKLLLFFSTLLFSITSLANNTGEQKQVFDNYEIHYIGLSTSFLPEQAAAAYNIPRSGSLGYLSISILKTDEGPMPVPVHGNITGEIRNLIGQAKDITFREIEETNAIYYISTFRFDDEDTYRVTLTVTPEGKEKPITVKFNQQFYEENE